MTMSRSKNDSAVLAMVMISLAIFSDHKTWSPALVATYVLLGISIVPFAFIERRHRISWILPCVLSAMIAALAIRESQLPRSDAPGMIAFYAFLSLVCAVVAITEGVRAWRRRGDKGQPPNASSPSSVRRQNDAQG